VQQQGHRRGLSDSVIVSKSCHPTFLVSTKAAEVRKLKSGEFGVTRLHQQHCAVDVHQTEAKEEDTSKAVEVLKKAKAILEVEKEDICDIPSVELAPIRPKIYSRIVQFSTAENVFSPYLKPP